MIHPDDEFETKQPAHDPMDFEWEDHEETTCPFDEPEETHEELETQNVRKVKIFVASSSGSLKTSYYSSINVDGHKGYYHATGYLRGANKVYEATVRCVLKALEMAIENLEGDTDDTPIEFLVITNMGSVREGYYKWSKGWKTNGYTNSSGKKVTSHSDWRKILKLADSHTIKLISAYSDCYAFKGCKKKAKALLVTKT